MSVLSDKIKAAKLKIEKLDIPEWGTEVFVRRMTITQRDIFLAATAKARESNDYAGIDRLLVALTLCDESGSPVFENQDELNDLDAVAIDRASKAAMRINALSKEAQEDIEKK